MRSKLKWIFTLLVAFFIQVSFAQEKTITGTVTDANGPLYGANVTVKGASKGVSTGFDGKYSVKAKEGDILVFSFMGMRDVLKTVGSSNVINTLLQDNSKTLTEVVIVAFGKQKKESVVGSNTQIKGEQFSQRSVTNVLQALEGAAPGLQIASGSGQPGSAPAIRVRGFSSVNFNSNPLYIVDGVQMSPSIGNPLNFINPDDVDTINLLKDASATSLYGSSAANGVVLITTKKGKSGKSTFNINVSTGFSDRSVPQYDRIDAQDYYLINWESIRNGRLIAGDPLATANNTASNNLITVLRNNVYNVPDNQLVVNGVFNPNATLKYSDLDWDSEILRTGTRQNADMSYSGGNEKTNYYSSLSYLKDTGYIINSDFERISGRLNVESSLKDWLKIGLGTVLSNTFSNNAVDGVTSAASFVNPYRSTRLMGPIYSAYAHNADGSNVYDANGNKVYDLFAVRGNNAFSGRHSIYENLANSNFDRVFNTNNRFTVDIKLTPSLTFSLVNGYNTRSRLNRVYTNNIIGDAAGAGAATRTTSFTQNLNFQQLLNYKKSIGNHNFDFLLGHESYSDLYEFITTSKRQQIASGNDELANFTTITDSNSSTDNYRKEAMFFSRLNYDFGGKYALSASVRRDGSSKFKVNTWDYFWSFGGRWNIDKESFLKDSEIIDALNLRASYGVVGNDNAISYYASSSTFDLGYNNGSDPGVIAGTVADPNLKWEGNRQVDLGLEFGLLKNRVSGSVELYKRTSQDLLFSVPTPLSSGNASVLRNIGNSENKGIELMLKVVPVKTPNFGLEIVANATRNINEVTKLPDGQTEIISGSKKIMVGKSINDFWLRQWWGVDPTDGSGLFLLSDALVGTPAADVRQINGQWLTTNANKAKFDYSGLATPTWFGSLGLNVSYKQLKLTSLITYQTGGLVYDTNYAALMSAYPEGTALHKDILTRWQNPGDITDVPRVDSNSQAQIGVASTRWLRKADYALLRNVTLNYSFKSNVLKDLGLSTLKIFASGENLLTFTSLKGMEAQETFDGTTNNRYSPARIITFGVNVGF